MGYVSLVLVFLARPHSLNSETMNSLNRNFTRMYIPTTQWLAKRVTVSQKSQGALRNDSRDCQGRTITIGSSLIQLVCFAH